MLWRRSADTVATAVRSAKLRTVSLAARARVAILSPTSKSLKHLIETTR